MLLHLRPPVPARRLDPPTPPFSHDSRSWIQQDPPPLSSHAFLETDTARSSCSSFLYGGVELSALHSMAGLPHPTHRPPWTSLTTMPDEQRRSPAPRGHAVRRSLPSHWWCGSPPTPHTHLPGDRLPAVDSSPPGPFHDGICSSLLPLRGSLVGREKDGGGYYFGGSSRRVCGGASASGYHGRFAWVLGEVQLVVQDVSVREWIHWPAT
ncbi:uncharacterized protein LOC119323539 [Triticum dicoccoides]|uniref:uncharacterized protein LOC119323539 n=1 Tax=Triticum dicoccoides TaxID=85692 RepID=UPI0018913A54|nr:uncharacterized protein LOC119323539 [Triticum dicoccoides]